jgi:alkylhydroperoxidase family enzyme
MTWIAAPDAATPFEGILGQRQELLARYRTFYASLWSEGLVPRRVLELCRLRIAAIHDCEAEWRLRDAALALTDTERQALRRGDFQGFDTTEQAALNIAEQTPFAHHGITDEQVAAVAAALGPKGTVTLLTALSFFDVTCRWKLVFGVPAADGVLDPPPYTGGALA